MFKREMKFNFKSFLIWTLVLMLLFILVFMLYGTIVNSESIDNINELIKVFPEDVLKMFNLDITHIDTAFGWMETEGFIFALLIVGVYSAMLGCNILLKEENDKTFEYLHSLPVKRINIVSCKVFASLIYILLMILLFGLSNYIALSLTENFDETTFIILSLSLLFPSIVVFALSLFISTFSHKTKEVLPICLGIVFVSYFLLVVSEVNDSVNFLKYFSVYTLADTRNIIINSSINWIIVIISLALTCIFIGLTIINYNKKELV